MGIRISPLANGENNIIKYWKSYGLYIFIGCGLNICLLPNTIKKASILHLIRIVNALVLKCHK